MLVKEISKVVSPIQFDRSVLCKTWCPVGSNWIKQMAVSIRNNSYSHILELLYNLVHSFLLREKFRVVGVESARRFLSSNTNFIVTW